MNYSKILEPSPRARMIPQKMVFMSALVFLYSIFMSLSLSAEEVDTVEAEQTEVKQPDVLLPQLAVFENPISQVATVMTLLGGIVIATGTSQWLTYQYYLSDPDIHRDLKDEALANPWANPVLIIGGSLVALTGSFMIGWQFFTAEPKDEVVNTKQQEAIAQ